MREREREDLVSGGNHSFVLRITPKIKDKNRKKIIGNQIRRTKGASLIMGLCLMGEQS